MGTFAVSIQVGDLASQQFIQVEALVDTGSTYTVLPGSALIGLGVEPAEQALFELADDRLVEYPVGDARIRLEGRERIAPVVFGPEGATPLLGSVTLEIFRLAVDPVHRRLVPVPALLK